MEVPSIKFHEKPSRGGLVVPCRQADMTNVIVAFATSLPPLKFRSADAVVYLFRSTLFLRLFTFHVVWTTSAIWSACEQHATQHT